MGHVGDAADIGAFIGIGNRADAAYELEHDPHAEHEHGGHGHDLPSEQHVHARLREHQNISAEHAGDGAGGSHIGHWTPARWQIARTSRRARDK